MVSASKGSDSDSEQFGAGGGFNTGGNFNVGLGQNWNQNLSGGTSGGSNWTQQGVWGGQAPYLQNMYGGASGLQRQMQPSYGSVAGEAGDYIGQTQEASMPAWQQQLQGGVYGQGGAARPYMQQLGNIAAGQGTNAYQQKLKDAMAADADVARQEMLGALDARAAASGMSGGSRHGTAIARGMGDINRNLLSNQANIGFQAEEAERARQMQANQMLGQAYGQQQATQTNALGQSGAMANLGMAGFNPLQAQWGGLQNQAGILGGPTILGSGGGSNWSQNFGFGQGLGQNVNMGGGFNYGDQWNRSTGEGSTDGGFSFGVGT